MQTLSSLDQANLYHAFLVEGGEGAYAEAVRAAERLLGANAAGHPDIYAESFESLGVDEARRVRERIYVRPLGAMAFTVILAEQITAEAQNALLKVLEEPPAATVFFLVTPSTGRLLPTLRSRMREIGSETGADAAADARAFIAAAPAKRIEMVKKIAEDKDRARARTLARGIMESLHAEFAKGKKEYAPALEETRLMSDYLSDASASPKLILEHLALVLPRA